MSWASCPVVFLILFNALFFTGADCKVRKYYIAAEDVIWDYTDSYQNLVNPDQQNYADQYLKQGKDRIGKSYWKTTYFQYTDATFTKRIPKPEYLGLLGPTIRGEVGDVIDVTYLNNATGVYSVHPHGLFYLKQNEGALYLDQTSGRYKSDEIVNRGQTVHLIWNITDSDAPGPSDPPCLPWVYHSHVDTVKDTSAGLVGALITCKQGYLNDNNERRDVAVDIPILMKIYDENLSWLIDANINTFCLDPAACRKLQADEDEYFVESNYMHSLNGKMFGHLKGLEACVGDRVAIYAIGFGNEFDVHSLYFQGQDLKYQHTRGDTVSVFTATFVAAETQPVLPGTWVVSDLVDNMARTGMAAFYVTKNCQKHWDKGAYSLPETVREYFLSAEEVEWDYGPGGKDLYSNKNLTEKNSKSGYFFETGNFRIGGKYKKARFFRYTDNSFKVKVQRSAEEEHMGILGPVIVAELGNIVKVTLKNSVSFPISFLPHALRFNYTEEIGNVAGSKRNMSGVVSPRQQHTYTFKVPSDILSEGSDVCQNYIYSSGVDPTRHHNTGLVGPILICRAGYNATADQLYKSYKTMSGERPLFMYATMFDENESMYLDDNIKRYLPSSSLAALDKEDEDFKASNRISTLNGFGFGTLAGMNMCLNEGVTFYAMALGSNEDIHSIGFDGNAIFEHGKNRNVHSFVAGTSALLHMIPDNGGSWLVQSISRNALQRGAYGLYHVLQCPGFIQQTEAYTGTREYFVAAVEVDWDFAPRERSLINGGDLNDPSVGGKIFIQDTNDFIGDVYRKAVFREYTDATFRQEKIRDVSEKHMDILGPVIRAEMFETITVHFMNKASRSYSMHPHGLKYSHTSSGRTYGNESAEVSPGYTRTYTWHVPARSGPGPADPDCIPWLYYSAVDQNKDFLSGLVGPIVICRPGTLDAHGRRKDQRPEFFVMMSIFNENNSWYLQDNIRLHAPNRVGTDYKNDEDFEESNKMHSINGRIFGNNPDLVMEYNKTVEWYFMVMGGKLDLHTIHTHGHTFVHTSNDHRDDVLNLFPGMAEVVEMSTDNPGTWLLHCHTLDHIAAGMETTYTVLKPGLKIPREGSLANTLIG